ncbi:MAG: AI-2E family transporter [Oxalobacteraceae bacterium]|nr:MAG: AI-2E family transporter [Oxalobacteraceae bacterium]
MPTERKLTASAVRTTAMLNGGAVVVAALYFGQELLVPLVLAGLLAFVLAPLARLLQRAYVPHVVASLLAVVIAFVILGRQGTALRSQHHRQMAAAGGNHALRRPPGGTVHERLRRSGFPSGARGAVRPSIARPAHDRHGRPGLHPGHPALQRGFA